MNFIPKEIKESLDTFKISFKKLFFTTSLTSEINFSQVFENSSECNCKDLCIKNCPLIPTTSINLDYRNNLNQKQDFLLTIKLLEIITNIENALYCLCIDLDNENKNIILFKGIISNYKIYKKNVSYPIKLNLPNKITFKIILLNQNESKNLMLSNNILKMGVIDLGFNFL